MTTATTTTDRIAAVYLDVRHIPSGEYETTSRAQVVLAAAPNGRCRVFYRTQRHIEERKQWQATESHYLSRNVETNPTAGNLGFALKSAVNFVHFKGYEIGQYTDGVAVLTSVVATITASPLARWASPVVLTLPNNDTNYDKLFGKVQAPWPVLNRIKGKYAAEGIKF